MNEITNMEQKVKERMKRKKRIDDHTEHLTQNWNKTSWQISQTKRNHSEWTKNMQWQCNVSLLLLNAVQIGMMTGTTALNELVLQYGARIKTRTEALVGTSEKSKVNLSL